MAAGDSPEGSAADEVAGERRGYPYADVGEDHAHDLGLIRHGGGVRCTNTG